MMLVRGTKVGSYEIQSPLGAGGMGEVYRATDTKLGRDVALKVLSAEMAHDAERLARFRREAKVLAQLDHPNIVTIYSVEVSEGVHFLTMQLVEGLPLDRLICANGLAVEQIVEIAEALAEALAAAHERGIVHRDLKPANVMVTNAGRVKVLDFGLAKDVSAESSTDATLTSAGHTQAGIVMGTPAYMSPEQVSGRTLDHRTDIFSLGVMLYEMTTGRRPFVGTSSAELVSSILRDSPPSVTEVRPELPSDIGRVIRRCLEKDPRHRVQTARDVSNEFRDLTRTSTRPALISTSPARGTVMTGSGSTHAAEREEGFWVAVLPFKYTGSNSDLKALADGLSEEVTTALSRFSYLRVIARGSTAKYSSESGDVRAIGKELGARYVMEGSLRQAGSKLRLAVQLADTVSGAHLWAETYERTFNSEGIFDLQDELVPRIVATVADQYGVLPHSMSEVLRQRKDAKFTPHEAVLRAFGYIERLTPEEHAEVRQILEKAVAEAPGQSDCWAMLSNLYWHEYALDLNPLPDSLARAHAAARRAAEAAPSNHLGHNVLAACLFFQKDIRGFRREADRCMELNPMDSSTIAFMGILLAYSGEWERGCAIVEHACAMNPNHPGWYHFAPFLNAYRKGDYTSALQVAFKIDMPGYPLSFAARAAALGQIGEVDDAKAQLRQLRALRPNFGATVLHEFSKWYSPELVEQWIEGLRKAGLQVPDADSKPTTSGLDRAQAPSGESRADEGFWVAVLPFKYTGGSAELKSLAEGLSEEVITGLSRFSYLHVIARGSTAKYSSESGDVRTIGKELGARYVMEGSIRQAGSKMRLAVQLVETTSGSNLWAETFERTFNADNVFELQDELVPRIVATVSDTHGILMRVMIEGLRAKPVEQLTAYEALVRSASFSARIYPEEHATARICAERAVKLGPDSSQAWAALAQICASEYGHLFSSQPDSLECALKAARRAVDTDSSNASAYSALAYALFLRKEYQAFQIAAERALELNPYAASECAVLGLCLAYSGDWEHGCAIAERAMKILPRHPGWFWFPALYNAYRNRNYQGAIRIGLKINLPNLPAMHVAMAAAYGQAGDLAAAQRELQELRRLMPNPAEIIERTQRWHLPEMSEHIIDGLRKAGLEIP